MEKLLEVKGLKINFETQGGLVQAVRGIDFDLSAGETLAIVGESGSGKSVTSRAVMGLLASNGSIAEGTILYGGRDITAMKEREFEHLRGKDIAMIFQDPMTSLNPLYDHWQADLREHDQAPEAGPQRGLPAHH